MFSNIPAPCVRIWDLDMSGNIRNSFAIFTVYHGECNNPWLEGYIGTVVIMICIAGFEEETSDVIIGIELNCVGTICSGAVCWDVFGVWISVVNRWSNQIISLFQQAEDIPQFFIACWNNRFSHLSLYTYINIGDIFFHTSHIYRFSPRDQNLPIFQELVQ